MRKANAHNLLVTGIIFLAFGILQYYFLSVNENLNVLKLGTNAQIIITGVLALIYSGGIYYAARTVFKRFIRHESRVKLAWSRFFLILAGLLLGFSFICFSVEYLYYYGSIILTYLIYFGLLYFFDNQYVKEEEEELIAVNDGTVTRFLELLGGKENVVEVSFEQRRLKVEVKNVKIVNLEELKNEGAQGLFVAGTKIQAIIGNNAQKLENAIKSYLSNC